VFLIRRNKPSRLLGHGEPCPSPLSCVNRRQNARHAHCLTKVLRVYQTSVLVRASPCFGPGISSDDTVTITFSAKTNMPDVSTPGLVDAVLFTPTRTVDWGSGYTGAWLTDTVLQVTLNDTRGVDPTLTRVDLMSFTVVSTYLKSEDESSTAATFSFSAAEGTWGTMTAPQVKSVVARDTGAQPGLGAGDSVIITFDTATDMVPISGAAAAAAVVEWSSPIGTMALSWRTTHVLEVRHPRLQCT